MRNRLEAEKDAIKQCLAICAQGASETTLLIQLMTDTKNKAEDKHNLRILPLSQVLDAIKENQGRLGTTTSSCETRLQDIERDLAAIKCSTERRVLQQSHKEKNSFRQCMEPCSKALENVKKEQRDLFEDVTADAGAFQAVMHSHGEQTTARRVKASQTAFQMLGSPPSHAGIFEVAKEWALMRHESPPCAAERTHCSKTSEHDRSRDETYAPSLTFSLTGIKHAKSPGRRKPRFS